MSLRGEVVGQWENRSLSVVLPTVHKSTSRTKRSQINELAARETDREIGHLRTNKFVGLAPHGGGVKQPSWFNGDGNAVCYTCVQNTADSQGQHLNISGKHSK